MADISNITTNDQPSLDRIESKHSSSSDSVSKFVHTNSRGVTSETDGQAKNDTERKTDVRPPIDYSSVPAFGKSVWERFESIWTKRFCLSLLAGQVVSLCITCTNVTTTELVDRNWALPTTQTWFLYVPLLPGPSGCGM